MTIKELEKFSKRFKWSEVSKSTFIGKFSNVGEIVKVNSIYLEPMFKEWAKNTKAYLSDIWYELLSIIEAGEELQKLYDDEELAERNEYPLEVMGIRDMGVDHPEFIRSRLESEGASAYKSIFKATVEMHIHGLDGERTEFIFRLYKADNA